MSESELILLQAQSQQANVTDALRDALDAIAKQLGPAGSGPHGLVSMEWHVDDPAAFHPSRMEVDLACREAFAGFTPTIIIKKAEHGLRVIATARPLPAPSGDLLYRTYDRLALARQYSPRLQADFKSVCVEWSRRSASFIKHHRGRDLRYGNEPFETLDLFYPTHADKPPLFVFFHGGYWQALDKSQHAHFAEGYLKAGFAVAMVNYALAPQASLETILDQCRASLHFLVREADALALNAAELHIAGHSAGGHIAAMLAADHHAPAMRSALLLSGVFDLEPLGLVPMGPILGLNDRDRARALSPLYKKARDSIRIAIAVGGAESDEFIRQSHDMAQQWKTAPALVLKDANHFTILDGLNGGDLLNFALNIQTGEAGRG